MKTINLQKVAVGLLCCSFVFFTSCSKDDTLDKLQQEVETMKKKQDEEAQKRKLKEEADKKKQQEEAEQKKKQDEENKQKQEEEKQKQEEKEKQREAEEQKRQEAERQRQEAEQKRQEAERQRQEAEQKRKEAEQKREQAGKKPEKAQGLTFKQGSSVKVPPYQSKAIDIVGGKAPYTVVAKTKNLVKITQYDNENYFSVQGMAWGETEIEVTDSTGKTGILKLTVGY
ncbi:hypothetical protein HMPREF9018_1225 [Prevotella amnii CRIS 21A-A]|uniref:Lipoprotein n=1 Tax=Prevotella amnii CRIS 21A-A TaxID=679191 RepID=E1GXB3_9BACT|nr:lipoprotein [Prevotella amnii]EFN90655.1 hypothetical protein HMPREF9018_1225 [Prevotella amnii CRIS 21A-A]